MNLRDKARRFVDRHIKPYSKAIVAGCGLAVQLAAGTVYADDVAFATEAVFAILTLVGIYAVPNVPADE